MNMRIILFKYLVKQKTDKSFLNNFKIENTLYLSPLRILCAESFKLIKVEQVSVKTISSNSTFAMNCLAI